MRQGIIIATTVLAGVGLWYYLQTPPTPQPVATTPKATLVPVAHQDTPAAAPRVSRARPLRMEGHGVGKPLAERITAAEEAVVGDVEKLVARWEVNEWGDRLIVSEVQVKPTRYLKGPKADRVVFDLEGGSLDGTTLEVSDLPVLVPGDQVFVLLRTNQKGRKIPSDRGWSIMPASDAPQ